jgi:hypothetical protein
LVAPDNFVPLEYDIQDNIRASLWKCLHYVYGEQLSMFAFQRVFLTAMGGIEDLKDVTDADLLENLIKSEDPDVGIMLFTAALKERSNIFVIKGQDMSERVYIDNKQPFRLVVTLIQMKGKYLVRLQSSSQPST